jgi:hypothetical protein
VIRVPFAGGNPTLPSETVRDGLTFPDGLGVYRPEAEPSAPPGPSAPGPVAAAAADSARSLPATGAGAAVVVPSLLLGGSLLLRSRR